MSEHLGIDLPDEFHHDSDNDDETGAGDEQIRGPERGVFGEEQRNDRDDTEEDASPEIQTVTGFG